MFGNIFNNKRATIEEVQKIAKSLSDDQVFYTFKVSRTEGKRTFNLFTKFVSMDDDWRKNTTYKKLNAIKKDLLEYTAYYNEHENLDKFSLGD